MAVCQYAAPRRVFFCFWFFSRWVVAGFDISLYAGVVISSFPCGSSLSHG